MVLKGGVFLSSLREQVKRHAKQRIIRAAMGIVKKKIVALIASLGWPLGGAILAAIIVLFMVYSALPGSGMLGGVEASEQDEVIMNEAKLQTDKWNVAAMYEVSGESSPDSPWHGRGGKKLSGLYKDKKSIFIDNNGRDAALANRWGDIYSTILIDVIRTGQEEFPIKELEKVASDLHPYFYYKPSTITVCTPDGEGGSTCSTEDIYLLVEAKTIRGWFQYHYTWQTDTFEGGGSHRYERIVDTKTLEKWEFLEEYLATKYEVPDSDREFTVKSVINASEGFTEKKEWMQWLLDNVSSYNWVSSYMVPAELKALFEEASQEYGIPWWFLAAVAFKESSFDPNVVRDDNGCFGLMQIMPSNWEVYAPRLGFDPISDKFNPRAQIKVGAYMLNALGLNDEIDWSKEGWQDKTLDVLEHYGGFSGVGSKTRAKVLYAEPIWAYAIKLQMDKLNWPLKEPVEITSSFGPREHPITKVWSHHNGIDLAAPMGTPIYSVSGGTVTAGYEGRAGNFVTVRDMLYSYTYMHMESVHLKTGDEITPGTVVGTVGSTGASTGPHLHFEIRELATGAPINPLSFLN